MSLRVSLPFAAIGLVAIACTPVESQRGYLPDKTVVENIKVGTDTKETITRTLGNPTTAATFGGDTWYYMTIHQRQAAFFAPEDTERDILAIKFDKDGKVADTHRYSLADGRVVDFVSRETPAPGRELTLLQQIFSAVPGAPISTQQTGSPGQ